VYLLIDFFFSMTETNYSKPR